MKFAALALDYDGTIAINGTMSSAVRRAIGDLRESGIAVLLVTGRRLPDLRQVAGDISCFDVVVAENGAVMEFPLTGRHVLLGHPPPPPVIRELQRRRMPFDVGESVLEFDGALAPAVLDIVRATEQPLILAFNRDRLMVLPQSISKATGLRQALFALRLSIHNTVGIGDAENDHDLLDACEVGVAVGWGSPALRAIADDVIQGEGPDAVADYIRYLARSPRLFTMGRRQLLLGNADHSAPFSLAVRGRTIVIAGERGTGKSWLAGLVCEQLILQGYCLCMIDPQGDYRSLEALPGVTVFGGDEPPPREKELVRALRHADVSVIVDLSTISQEEKREYLRAVLPAIAALRRRTGLPHKILLDRAHQFLGSEDSRDCVDVQLAGYILVTDRFSALEPSICSLDDTVILVTRETDPLEGRTLATLCGAADADASLGIFRALALHEAALLPGAKEAGGVIRRFQLAPRLTTRAQPQGAAERGAGPRG